MSFFKQKRDSQIKCLLLARMFEKSVKINHAYTRVPPEKSRTLPLLPWKDFVPLRSKCVMIGLVGFGWVWLGLVHTCASLGLRQGG